MFYMDIEKHGKAWGLENNGKVSNSYGAKFFIPSLSFYELAIEFLRDKY